MDTLTRRATTDVLVAMSNELVRHGVQGMLRGMPEIGSVLSPPSPPEAVSLLEFGPDLLVVGADEDARELLTLAAGQGVKVLLVLDRVDEASVERAAGLPADGLLVQEDLGVETLGKAVRSVLNGEFSVPPSLGRYLLVHGRTRTRPLHEGPVRLTSREKEVMSLLVDGLGNKQIARKLAISEHGVKRHVTNLLAKLNSPNRTLAVARALRSGLV